jgi:outer membrane lipoprotein-sorting protein
MHLAASISLCLVLLTILAGYANAVETSEPITDFNSIALSDPNNPNRIAAMIHLAKTDHITMLKAAIDNYEKNIRDYTGTMHSQERIGRRLGKKRVIEFKFMEKPFSLFMRWKKNPAAASRMLFVEGSHKNKMIVMPKGVFSVIGSVRMDPNSRRARASGRKPCTMFGFYRTMKSALRYYEVANKKNELKIKYVGPSKVDGRDCIRVERILPKRKYYETARLVIDFDIEYLLATSVTLYDWKNRLLARYSYTDLKFNTGLKKEDFAPARNKL